VAFDGIVSAASDTGRSLVPGSLISIWDEPGTAGRRGEFAVIAADLARRTFGIGGWARGPGRLDPEALCLALTDWSWELRLLQRG
jgi:hypothetical protein